MDKTKKPTAFEQSLQRIHADSQALYDQSQKVSLPVLHDMFMHALQTFQSEQKAKLQMPKDRAKKGSFDISTLKGGQKLKSDGSVDQPNGEQNAFEANTQPQQSALSQLMTHLQPQNEAANPDPNTLSQGPATPTQAMTDDLLHSLDTTTGQAPLQAGESYPVGEGEDGQSTEFYAGLQGKTGTGILDKINDFLNKRLVDNRSGFSLPNTPQAPLNSNNRVQLGLRDSYGAMFNQAPVNQSAQPNNQVWSNLFKELQTEDKFGG